MNALPRSFSEFASDAAKGELAELLEATTDAQRYREHMTGLGRHIGHIIIPKILAGSKCLIAATAEDADFLAKGVIDVVQLSFDTRTAIFWNNHYSNREVSIAPIVHQFLQPGFESADSLIIVKSVISGSCVVRTNLLALIE